MALESGQKILGGKYRIEELVGEGAFAEVYRATHIRLGVTRAIKVLRKAWPGVGSTVFQGFQERFALEARLGAQLDDPHIIRVYDFEEEEDTLHLVMEYAPGGSLAARIAKQGPLPVDEVVKIGLGVAKGLAALHQNQPQIIHRDLKPSNILFDVEGRAKVSDLGLAQIPGRSSSRSHWGSLAGAHPGTPEYMSPEQEREAGYLQPPSDVYALGCVLFEMLTGRLYKTERPGTRVRELRTEVPDWLDALVERCLKKEKEERPWDGAEVMEALDAEQRARREKLARLYETAQVALQAKRWQQAIRHCDDIAAIDAGYRDVAQLRAQAEAGLQAERREAEERARRDLERQARQREERQPPLRRIPLSMWGVVVLVVVMLIAVGVWRASVPRTTSTPEVVVKVVTITPGPVAATVKPTTKVVIEETSLPVPPTATQVPSTSTSVPPTATPVPPTPTPTPPTVTSLPPTSTPAPPTDTPMPPTATHTPRPTETPTLARATASIAFPQDGAGVGESVAVRGTITGLRSDQRAFLCVQSTAFGRLIFPQGELFADSSGNWVVESIYRSVGYNYETYVVVTDNPDSAEMLADQYYRGYGMKSLPADTFIASRVIVVKRE